MRGGLSILVIDDNKIRASIIEEGLRDAGHEKVILVHQMEGLVRQIADINPDVIVIDLENPNRDRLEHMFQVSRAVQRPIAMFVDKADSQSIEAAVDAGVKRVLVIPLIGILAFLAMWAALAPQVQTSLGAVPGPAQVWTQTVNLWEDHVREREKADAFYERQDARNAKFAAEGKTDRIKHRNYTGKPTYIDQIGTSLKTVGLGFLIATIIAVPLGIASGLSRTFNGAINPNMSSG